MRVYDYILPLLFLTVSISLTNSFKIYKSLYPSQIIAHQNCIISNKKNNIYSEKDTELYYKSNEFIKDKELISISPGGFKGFYLMGVLSYIKETYDLENFIYSGASAGSWNGLFMCYKGNSHDFVYNLLDENIRRAKSITELQYFIKYKLLSSYKEDDFDLRRIFIGVTHFKNFKPNMYIYSEFENLEDTINCCMASSHIPLITGGLTNRYHNMFSFDGGFSKYPYLNIKNPTLHVSPSMWAEMSQNKNKIQKKLTTIKQFSEFFSMSKNNLLELYDNGYADAKKHRHLLDSRFALKTDTEF